jgi:hypothetical protein
MKVIYENNKKMHNLTKIQTEDTRTQNYARVVSTTNTYFTQEEIQLLNKGLKYNLHHKPKNWI